MEDYIEYQDVKNIGTPFELLSTEEMNEIIGSGSLDNEVSPMSGPPCFFITMGSALLLTFTICQNN